MTILDNRFKLAVIAASISFALPVVAEDASQNAPDANGTPAVPQVEAKKDFRQSELFMTYMSVVREISALETEDDTKTKIDALTHFDFSPDTRQKLAKLFGNDKPLHATKTDAAGGGAVVDVTIDPLRYTDPEGKTHGDWSGMTLKSVFDPSYTKSDTRGHSDSFIVSEESGVKMEARGFDLQYVMHQEKDKLWLGDATATINSISMGPSDAKHVTAENLSLKVNAAAHGDGIDASYNTTIQSVSWANDRLGPIHFNIAFKHVDRQALIDMRAAAKAINADTSSAEEHTKKSLAMMTDLGKRVVMHGVEVDLQALSVEYHGQTAKLAGKLNVPANKKGAAAPVDVEQKLKSSTARLDVQVPMAFAEDVASTFMKSMSNGATQGASDEQVHAMAAALVKQQLSNKQAQRFLRVDHNMIRSTLEWKGGKLTANGHPLDFSLPHLTPKPTEAKPQAKE